MSQSEKVNDDQAGGTGGKSARTEGGRTVIQDARMTERAIREGWISGRWPTDTPRGDLVDAIRTRGDISLKERATLTAYQLLENKDARAQGIGVRCVVSMEKQNQIDQLSALNAGNDPTIQQPTTRTPDQYVDLMDASIPNVKAV